MLPPVLRLVPWYMAWRRLRAHARARGAQLLVCSWQWEKVFPALLARARWPDKYRTADDDVPRARRACLTRAGCSQGSLQER